jgi:cholesterol oxidase
LTLGDGFRIKLTRYQGGMRGPVILAPGFGVRASSFAIDTVEVNLVEYLTKNQYDVWLFDYRASPDAGNLAATNRNPTPYTIDDIATTDWPAAVQYVLERTGAKDLQVLAHCVGSMSLLMALLNGMSGVRSVISSQLTLHPVTDWLSYLKTDINVASLLCNLGDLNGRIPIVPGDTDLDKQMDVAISIVPIPDGEQCKNPVCRRIFSVFGASYTHSQLNHWTHTAMGEMFGDVAIKPFEHLSLIMERGRAVDHNGDDAYMRDSQVRNLALPISFVAGAANRLFYPQTANTTYRWLCSRNDPTLYKFHTIEGYAHMDLFIGRNAAEDVYPFFLAELDRFNPARQG